MSGRMMRLAMMGVLVGASLLLGGGATAVAQQAAPGPDAVAMRAWQGFAIAQENAVEKIDALIRAYKISLDELGRAKAELDYWRTWCGDKPGCER